MVTQLRNPSDICGRIIVTTTIGLLTGKQDGNAHHVCCHLSAAALCMAVRHLETQVERREFMNLPPAWTKFSSVHEKHRGRLCLDHVCVHAGLAFFNLDDTVDEVFQHLVAEFFTLIVYACCLFCMLDGVVSFQIAHSGLCTRVDILQLLGVSAISVM